MADLNGPKEGFTYAHLDSDLVKAATETANWQIDDFTKILSADFAAVVLPGNWDPGPLPIVLSDIDGYGGIDGYDGSDS
ncbi:MAG: hypothetical protein QOJ96_3739 [Alphaproteobacteria bacterium]|jgi:hypothetical protein|nr:hypothetical protein [Alphaproteobacteria bacterium]